MNSASGVGEWCTERFLLRDGADIIMGCGTCPSKRDYACLWKFGPNCSVPDPWRFDTDPDLHINTTGLRIRSHNCRNHGFSTILFFLMEGPGSGRPKRIRIQNSALYPIYWSFPNSWWFFLESLVRGKSTTSTAKRSLSPCSTIAERLSSEAEDWEISQFVTSADFFLTFVFATQ